ncbi:MAG: FAD-dependent oxidoreductase, partial [Spirochaetota bacterium]|nr:FAD-dependent oxidoreductase [Spirochaetota bacterium]
MSDSAVPGGAKAVLVIGGGLSGMTTAIEAAEVGYDAIIIEKLPYLGGRVTQLNQYFPKLCPPYCGLEINYKRIKANPRITALYSSEVTEISGREGNFTVKITESPRYINENCTACGDCVAVCPAERPNSFNFGMDKTKAVYLPHEMAYPMKYVIDDKYCQKESCGKCVEACKYQAIDLAMKEKTHELSVGAVVYATGWNPYEATKMDNLGMGRYENVLSNIMLERIAAANGPTKG